MTILSTRARRSRSLVDTAVVGRLIVLFLPLALAACTPPQQLAPTGRQVVPFPLSQVRLSAGLFRQKQERMLRYAREYGGSQDIHAGPDRLLSIFRANAGLDTRGAEPVGGWETATGYLRGHYAGHFLSLLAQAYAGTGDPVYKEKLDHMVAGLAECQAALAAAARRPTPRVAGRLGGGLRLTGSPLGNAEHVRLPGGDLGLSTDMTIATWIRLSLDDAALLPDERQTPEELINGTVVFDFGSPNDRFAEPPLRHMYLTVRVSNEKPVPRFAITREGVEGEQSLEGTSPLPIDRWVHLAVTRNESTAALYIDGERVDSSSDVTLSAADLGPMASNWIGRRQFPQRSVSYLNATVDDFLVLDRGLSQQEVRTLMSSPASIATTDATAWFRFDEQNGPTAFDASGNGRDAEIVAPTDSRRHPGFLSAYPETPFVRLEELATYGASQGIWAPYYTLHKIMAGLIDAYVLTDNQQALDVLVGVGDWVHDRLASLPQEQLDGMWDIYIAGEYGGINESLATLSALVSDRPEYLETARRFVNRNVFLPTVANHDVLAGRHANQHIPQFTGYLRTYEVGQEEDYLAAARNFWDMIVPARVYSHGGVGVGEMLRVDATAASLFEEANHAETCPLYNLLKLSRNLFFHDPDARYMDYYEQGLFNQMAGSRRDVDSVDSPEVTYFVPVRPGSRRSYGNVGTCCGGTGLESHTKYQDSIYFRSVDATTLYVNLYIASTLRWPERDLTLTQETEFPREGASRLVFGGRGALVVALRVPSWAVSGYRVSVNGEAVEAEPVPGTYLRLERRWNEGDTIDIDLPLRFRVESKVDDPTVQSIYYGPVLLAVQSPAVGEDLASGLVDMSFYRYLDLAGDLASAMRPGTELLHFSTNGFELAPLFIADPVPPTAADDTRPYHLYFRRSEPEIVFGSVESGVHNGAGPDGITFLDRVWSDAPFADHRAFLRSVETTTGDWLEMGNLTADEAQEVLAAAARAESDLVPRGR